MNDNIVQHMKQLAEAYLKSKTANDILPLNQIMKQYINIGNHITSIVDYENKQINEYRSTFLSKDNNNNWADLLAQDLYDAINGQWNRNDYNQIVISNIRYKQLPQIPFLDYYTIHVCYQYMKDDIGYKANASSYNPNTGEFVFEVTFNLKTSNLKGIIYSFIYHEFMHSYQTKVMGTYKMADYIKSSHYHDINNIIKNPPEPLINQYLEVIKDILYHTHKLEQNAYNSQSIGDHIHNMKSSPEYIALSKNDKLKYLYMGKIYDRLYNEYKELENDLLDSHPMIQTLIVNYINDILNSNIKTIQSLLSILKHKIDKAYNNYCRKVGKWITEQYIKECEIRFI